MHRLHSRSTVIRFRLAALLLCLKLLLPFAVAGILCSGWLQNDTELLLIGLGVGLLTSLICVLQWLIASRTRCPLCLTPLMIRKGCSKHRNARTLLGSHHLKVAMNVLFRDSFTCPYCHESSAVEVRRRHGYRDNQRD